MNIPELNHILGLLGIGAFALTAVIASQGKDTDIIGIVLLGLVTALGGGTIRDLLIGAEVFWIADITYFWAAMIASVIGFFTPRLLLANQRLVLYIDAVAVSVFAVLAAQKVMFYGYRAEVAVFGGVVTGITGGLIRDVLISNRNLLQSSELYVTPIALGTMSYLALNQGVAEQLAIVGGIAVALGFRAAAIHWQLGIPRFLHFRSDESL